MKELRNLVYTAACLVCGILVLFLTLLWGIVGGSSGPRSWNDYYTVEIFPASRARSAVFRLQAWLGPGRIVSRYTAQLLFSTFDGQESVPVGALDERLDPLDPRLDRYMREVERLFGTHHPARAGTEAGENGEAGDLYIVVHMKPHEKFKRDGENLYTEKRITFPEAALGGNLIIETLDGTATLKIPPGTESGDMFKIKGKGMPKMRGFGYGDLYVKIQVETPKKLSRKAKRLIEELSKEISKTE